MKAIENKVFVFDNIIDVQYQENIKNILMGEGHYKDQNFPWYYTEDITGAGDYDSQHRAALGHNYVELLDDDKTTKCFLLQMSICGVSGSGEFFKFNGNCKKERP